MPRYSSPCSRRALPLRDPYSARRSSDRVICFPSTRGVCISLLSQLKLVVSVPIHSSRRLSKPIAKSVLAQRQRRGERVHIFLCTAPCVSRARCIRHSLAARGEQKRAVATPLGSHFAQRISSPLVADVFWSWSLLRVCNLTHSLSPPDPWFTTMRNVYTASLFSSQTRRFQLFLLHSFDEKRLLLTAHATPRVGRSLLSLSLRRYPVLGFPCSPLPFGCSPAQFTPVASFLLVLDSTCLPSKRSITSTCLRSFREFEPCQLD